MTKKIVKDRGLPLALRAAYLALHRNTEATFSKYGVTADQFVLMLALQEGRLLTQRELAKRIWSDSSTVRAMLVLLETSGYVQRTSNPNDSRARSVELTAAGKRKLRMLWKIGQPIRDSMYGCMSKKESELLIELLAKLANTLGRDRPEKH